MAAIENEKVYGLKIRESANDGSDFGTPDADYRFLFLGEDGVLHTKDATPTVRGVPAGFHGVRIIEATAQSVANNTATALTSNDAETYDTDSYHDTASNTSRLTVAAAVTGYYHIGGYAFFASSATGYRQVQIRVDGTTGIATNRHNPVDTTTCFVAVSTDYALTAGQYVELVVTQTSGGNLDVSLSGFWMHLIGV